MYEEFKKNMDIISFNSLSNNPEFKQLCRNNCRFYVWYLNDFFSFPVNDVSISAKKTTLNIE